MKLVSTAGRAAHLGPYPLETLHRVPEPDFGDLAPMAPLATQRPEAPLSLVNAMAEYQAMMDTIRTGAVAGKRSEVPACPAARATHLKGFGYFSDAAMVGVCRFGADARLAAPFRNPEIARLASELATRQTKTLAAGIDLIMADLRDAMAAPPEGIGGQDHAIVFLYECPREPGADEPGCAWLGDAQAHRAALRAGEAAIVIANYLRVLGWKAAAHTATSSDVDLGRLAVAAGLGVVEQGAVVVPWLGQRFGLAAVTTDFEIAPDAPLAPMAAQPLGSFAWRLGTAGRGALARDPFAKRKFRDGPHPFERLKRVERPTTYLDEPRIPRVPKRTDMFARAQFGDMGPDLQREATGGHYVRKAAPSMAQRRMLGALVLLQDGPPEGARTPISPEAAADAIKAASYFLGVDAVGISRCPDWAWYSHDARGEEIDPPHDQAISMIIDQGYETMEGASGDDWISVAQSMRAYLRFSLLGGVIAKQIRRLGYSAKAHSVMDGEVLQPPLLLLSGLGEVSRIGEVILNPYLGPRLKSGIVTTDLPLAHDKPIDFGLQNFCENCRKCARECPSGAITAGPKLMFNGYEIWKSDSQKCASYRIGTKGGAMCGRCMKTCPWNLEGLFAEAPFRWAASHMPAAAPLLARLDDWAGRGGLNPAKKWWWDLELQEDGAYRAAQAPVNARGLQRDLDLRYEDQTLAVYPADLAPHPWPYPAPMDREAGIAAYQALITAEEYQARAARGETDGLAHTYRGAGNAPVLQVEISQAVEMADGVSKYEFTAPGGGDLPPWEAGAHIDIVVAPEYLRQYSLSGDPAERGRYQIGVLCEAEGRGGSALLHRIFTEGRKVFISRPINHFPLVEQAGRSLLMGGGIGITPMIAMAHRLHALNADFALHYAFSRREGAGFLADLAAMPWAGRVHLHCSAEGTRADLSAILGTYRSGDHVYTCGPQRFMDAVLQEAAQAGFPEDARHFEYFDVPELPARENHAFTLRLARSGREIAVPADRSATDMLREAGIAVDVKCADGICGVCKCGLLGGAADHRDFVLSAAQRRGSIILCQSRASEPGGILEIDL